MKKKLYFKSLGLVLLITLRAGAQEFPVFAVEKKTYERLVQAQKEFRAAVETGDSLQIAETSYVMGKRYAALNDYQKGHYFYSRALKIFAPLGRSQEVGKIYMRLAEWSFQRNEFHTSLTYVRRAHPHLIKDDQKENLANMYKMLADIHHAGWYDASAQPRSDFSLDSSFYYYDTFIQTARQYKLTLAMAHGYQFLAKAYEWKKDFINTIKYSKEAYILYRQENQTVFASEAGTRVGIAYTQLGESAKAKKWLEEVEALNDTAQGIRDAQRSIAKQWLGIHYQQVGDWKKAAEYQRQQYELLIKDIEYYRTSVDRGARLLYESEQKEAKLQDEKKTLQLALSIENQRRQTWLNAFIALLLIGAAVAGVVYYRLFRKYKETSRHNAELVKEQSHRIKNNLQSVSDLLTLQLYDLSDPRAIQALEESLARVNAMSLIHRRLYDGNQPDEVALATFIPDLVKSTLRSYDLEHVQVFYNLDDIRLHADKAITLALIVNELTTNAGKYAFEPNPNPTLEISCHLSGQEVRLTFLDNGPGFTYQEENETSTFGLGLIRLLVKKLHGKSSFSNLKGSLFELSFTINAKPQVNRKKRLVTGKPAV